MTRPRSQRFLDDGLEELRRIDPTRAQGQQVFGHIAISNANEHRRVDPSLPQILLEAEPRGRHLADCGDAHSREVGEPEARIWISANDRERVTTDDLGKADEG